MVVVVVVDDDDLTLVHAIIPAIVYPVVTKRHNDSTIYRSVGRNKKTSRTQSGFHDDSQFQASSGTRYYNSYRTHVDAFELHLGSPRRPTGIQSCVSQHRATRIRLPSARVYKPCLERVRGFFI